MSKFQVIAILLLVTLVAFVELAEMEAKNSKLMEKLKAPASNSLKNENMNENNNRMKREAVEKLKASDANNKLKGGGYGYYNSYDSYYPYYDSYYPYYDSYYYDSYGSYDSYYYDSYYYDSYYRR